MSDYDAPVRDMLFVINELADLKQISSLPGYEDAEPEIVEAVLEEGARLAGEVLSPLNWSGDQNGATIADGNVTASPGFGEAYRQFREGGWTSLPAPAEVGGQGLPSLVSFAVEEMWHAANMAFSLCPMLTQAAVEALERHGTSELKTTYLPKLVGGEWTGAMDLTEPQAGSDLAALTCKAESDGDHYRLSGQKIYITWGDHDMTDNILHMVLARTPDAPEGVKGISLFLVPKFLVKDDGSLGERNDMRPVSLEHKLGIHASPTCVMSFGDNDGAVGYLVGEENNGLACMFTMMNHARLNVGVEGLGIAERAYQRARAYARDRVQGTSPDKPGRVTIIHHPDVRRMLMLMKSQVEGMRALAYTTATSMDFSRHASDPELRTKHKARLDLLVPVVKGWCTEQALEVTSLGVQIHGGMGYVEETGAAQHMRDARIATIYEGTTGIQGQDLAGRKVLRDSGQAMFALIEDMRAEDVALARGGDEFAEMRRALTAGVDCLEDATRWLLNHYRENVHAANAAAVNLMMLTGTVAAGWQMARAGLAARRKLNAGADGTAFLEAKIVTARFYAEHVLPRSAAIREAVVAGSESMMALTEAQF